jgi:hypothetical protein
VKPNVPTPPDSVREFGLCAVRAAGDRGEIELTCSKELRATVVARPKGDDGLSPGENLYR